MARDPNTANPDPPSTGCGTGCLVGVLAAIVTPQQGADYRVGFAKQMRESSDRVLQGGKVPNLEYRASKASA
jgi:hypothetical protein